MSFFALSLFALGKVGYTLYGRLALLVLRVLIDGGVAGEHELGVAGAEAFSAAGGLYVNVVIYRVGHLARREASPDQAVEHILLAREILAHELGREGDIRRTYRLVRVLGSGASLVAVRLLRAEGLAVVLFYIRARGGNGLLGDAQRIGTHIGYEAYRALAGYIDALVELLGYAHRAPGRHPQAARGLLLQRARYERGRGAALLLAALHAVHGEGAVLNGGYHGVRLFLTPELDLAGGVAIVARRKLALIRAQERRVEQPVFLGHKGAYLALAVYDHARGD